LILAALPGAIQGIPAYCSLLRVLAKVNDPAAMKALVDAANVTNEEVRGAAIRGLAEWPSPEAAPVILGILRHTEAEAQRDLLLRGYLRMLEIQPESGVERLVTNYAAALAEASSSSEKKLMLGSLGNQRSAVLLPFVAQLLEDPEVSEEAAAAYSRLQRAAFVPSASHLSEEAERAIDGDPSTRWTTGTPQRPDQWFEIDLGGELRVRGVTLDATGSAGDFPRRYEVYGTSNPERWGPPLVKGEGNGAVILIDFSPKKMRHIRIVQQGSAEGQYWSIHELRVHVD
jgi:HEAT repeat protein